LSELDRPETGPDPEQIALGLPDYIRRQLGVTEYLADDTPVWREQELNRYDDDIKRLLVEQGIVTGDGEGTEYVIKVTAVGEKVLQICHGATPPFVLESARRRKIRRSRPQPPEPTEL